MTKIADTPVAPYYVVVFSSILKDEDDQSYFAMAKHMEILAEEQEGFLGIESARSEIGITVSYWKDEASIIAWKNNAEHIAAQKLGKDLWYKSYKLRIGKIERAY